MSRKIATIRMNGLTPGIADTPVPEFIWVKPTTLLVDETYQRDLSRKSLDMIHRIVSGWDWARFKPPVVAMTAKGYEVIDGQHTAIAAAMHPKIGDIPVMVVVAAEMSDRASAFVGHNRDRLTLSQVQIHYAAVAAGDEDALTVQQVCDRAGVVLLRYPPGNGEFKPGESLAIGAVRSLINRRGAMSARIVLEVLADAHCAPVRSDEIKAVDALLNEPEYKGHIASKDLVSEIMKQGPKAALEAKIFAAAHNVSLWRAMVVILYKGAKRGRRSAA